VPGWKDTGVPNPLDAEQVQVLLDSCDRSTNSGKRDLAVLLMLARLGLRAADVAGLGLDDFDWRVGEVIVHGKAGRCDRMPLPAEVGEAVGRYLLEARPRIENRTVFLTLVAPTRPMKTSAIGQVVWRRCQIAGVEPVRAHRLRHALATDLQVSRIASDASFGTSRERLLPAARRAASWLPGMPGALCDGGDLGRYRPPVADATMMRLVPWRGMHHGCAC